MEILIALVGPTGVGKSEVALHIAEHFGIPIINADSRQLYRDIPIGTAAPTQEQRSRVHHYFVGTLDINDYFSASMFEQQVMDLFATEPTICKSQYALLSGGSMMYVDAVCNGIDDIPTIDNETRELMKQRLDTFGLEALCEELRLLDPEYYSVVDRKNTRRVVHALEICYMTGKPYSLFRNNKAKERHFKIIKIGVNRPREELYHRINDRVLQMMDEGLLEEVLRVEKFRGANSLNTVGYKEMFDYIDGLCTMEYAVDRIQSNTRKYARKQLTWYKRDKSVKWFHPDQTEEIIDYIHSM